MSIKGITAAIDVGAATITKVDKAVEAATVTKAAKAAIAITACVVKEHQYGLQSY
jgi:hypothetical protein